jgi:hypothetical protein
MGGISLQAHSSAVALCRVCSPEAEVECVHHQQVLCSQWPSVTVVQLCRKHNMVKDLHRCTCQARSVHCSMCAGAVQCSSSRLANAAAGSSAAVAKARLAAATASFWPTAVAAYLCQSPLRFPLYRAVAQRSYGLHWTPLQSKVATIQQAIAAVELATQWMPAVRKTAHTLL